MSNLVDKLIPKIDGLRQTFADKFGLRAFDLYQIIRTWSDGEVGAGTPSSVIIKITPTPKIKFTGEDQLLSAGREEDRKVEARNTSLTYTEGQLTGDPKAAGVEVFWKLVERNGQAETNTYWILSAKPEVERGKIGWHLKFKHYHTTE